VCSSDLIAVKLASSPGMDANFTAMWEESVGWDGHDPLRRR